MLKKILLLLVFLVGNNFVSAQECDLDVGDLPTEFTDIDPAILNLTPDELNKIESEQAGLSLSDRMQLLLTYIKLKVAESKDRVAQHVASHKVGYSVALAGTIVAIVAFITIYKLTHKKHEKHES